LNDLAKNVILWVLILIVLRSVVNTFGINGSAPSELRYSAFLSEIDDGIVADVIFEEKKI
jgi:cell division protease FtsH